MTPYYADDWLTILQGDCRAVLAELPAESVHCVVTSPPYWGLRDYGVGGQLGLEATPEAYVAAMVEVFREVRRVLRKDGTLWLNLGDSYASGAGKVGTEPGGGAQGAAWKGNRGSRPGSPKHADGAMGPMTQPNRMPIPGLKPKDRAMIPARVALALQADGWWLRDEIVWHKPNPMPSSVEDRTTPAHEMVYLLSRSARYHYDAAAIREGLSSREINRSIDSVNDDPAARPPETRPQVGLHRQKVPGGWDIAQGAHGTVHREGRTVATYRERNVGGCLDGFAQMPGGETEWAENGRDGRNKRSVWTVATSPYPEAHFATFPPKLIEPMILAGCPADGTVLDPFAGSGTTGMVAQSLSRRAILIDLNADYLVQAMGRNRDIPLGLVG